MRRNSKNSLQKNSNTSKPQKLFLLFFGFAFGLFLTYTFYLTLATQFKIKNNYALYSSFVFSVLLLISICCFKALRCFFFLLLPQVFSKRGRAAIIAYAYLLTVAGPTKNLVENVHVLSASLSCGQEQVKILLNEVNDALKVPFLMLKEAVEHMIDVFQKFAERTRMMLLELKRTVSNLVKGIERAFSWLNNIVNVCNKKAGTPYRKCTEAFQQGIQACRKKLGIASFVCEVTSIAEPICYTVKFIDYLCELIDFVDDKILEEIHENLKIFLQSTEDLFYVSISFRHKFEFKTNASKSLEEINEDILADIKMRTRGVTQFFGYVNLICSFFFICVILKTLRYRNKYMTNNRFDNSYILNKFYEIDEQRLKMNKETLLPLNRKERKQFIEISSWRLVKNERRKIFKSGFFLFISSVHIASFLIGDYSLFWILALINFHESQMEKIQIESDFLSVNVTGEGFVSDLCKEFAESFMQITRTANIDPSACMPHPHIPNFDQYRNIMLLLLSSWILIFLEPYGLRVRQLIMNIHYPKRSNERAVWLYNHILVRRMNFIKFARREMRKKFLKDSTRKKFNEDITCMEMIRAKVDNFWILRKIFGSSKIEACMLCGMSLRRSEDYARCERPGCSAIYCSECYLELHNTCSLCMEPMEYGDFSDISEEVDSSDEGTKRP